MSEDLEQIRAKIITMHDRTRAETYYQILEVDLDTEEKDITTNYRRLAKVWHIDRFSNLELGDYRKKVQEIFQYINNAHRVLTDEDARAEYDMEINEGPDVAMLLNAENAFMRGKNLLNSGRSKGAHEFFKQAMEWNPEEREYRAYFLYTEYLDIPKNQDTGIALKQNRAAEIYKELEGISEELKEKDWLYLFLGTVGLGIGRERQAAGLFREALMVNPRNHNAKRQLRLLEMRKDNKKGGGGGFLDKLLAKFR